MKFKMEAKIDMIKELNEICRKFDGRFGKDDNKAVCEIDFDDKIASIMIEKIGREYRYELRVHKRLKLDEQVTTTIGDVCEMRGFLEWITSRPKERIIIGTPEHNINIDVVKKVITLAQI